MAPLSRTLLAWISLGAWGWALLVALLDRRHGRGLGSASSPASDASVSVIVPARNEAGRLAAALATLEAQTHPAFEVIVVDDQSEDATYAEAAGRASGRIRVVRGAPLPTGWVGKSWAIHQGIELATGDWLLFTDADVAHAPDTVERALALAEEHDLPGITVLPLLESVSPVERIVQPAAAVLIRSFVAPGPLVRLARSRTAIAAGGFILLRRDVYDAVGGHSAIRDRLVDDKALAEEVKRVGRPLAIVDGEGRVRVRMYRGAREIWRGWRKNTSVGLAEGSPLVAAGAAVVGGAVAVWPWVALVRGRVSSASQRSGRRRAHGQRSPRSHRRRGATPSPSRSAASSSRRRRSYRRSTGSAGGSSGAGAVTRRTDVCLGARRSLVKSAKT